MGTVLITGCSSATASRLRATSILRAGTWSPPCERRAKRFFPDPNDSAYWRSM